MDLNTFLVVIHVIGTILGVGGATIAEVQVTKALKDGTMDVSEQVLLHADYTVIRVGIALIVLSGISLVWWHLSQGNNWVLTSAKLWAKEALVLFIILNAIFLSKHWMPLWLGSAISFTSWWMATILGLWHGVPFNFTQLMVGYLVLIFIVAGILSLIRKYYSSI